jgi:hypothetical protein
MLYQVFSHSSPQGGQRIVYPYQVGSIPIYGASIFERMLAKSIERLRSNLDRRVFEESRCEAYS